MQLYPAIDIKKGQCVRLRQGKFEEMDVYSNTPEEVAKEWERLGGTFIHVVDLDGALVGKSVNEETIKKIVEAVNVPVQVGGGIRTIQDIERKLNLGVSRVIIGTKAVEDPNLVKEAIRLFGPEKIVIGIDAKNGMVAVEGWEKVSKLTALDLCKDMASIGVKTVVYTDIAKDGMLMGPNLEYTGLLASETGLDIIASGGVSSLKDLENLEKVNVEGAIIGKALYTNNIQLDEAVRMFERGE
ncbi:1-(5-phosphoribosyl)-5-[(5-phosphoribosylamino)methylideneamino] imidazole-4-carboxamide isomerase [Natranaerovirga pectinivora]|uniref:1-(5-phosphoribosyl)-5-[(5-phosphoribosylamino)methylideneamino] imidazole-4-carboxamide isomerase n=1 Tax=Natranaerovirga pectinivora TaxID=682400 RepID=A0A4R3MQF6_9FIRM|nr:1-(5-phosphoribosyl)-5-[(5-phosphoribosylamino)methylideneamino]imidazole-4-carboxamide isomerase [Natranaerovirga pectinivora]TCT17024.1 1-(5-phosphoribosyl)-5-[(5-phosphoribosylamino)methylideneamino] imidazole-4-carboxamide isomerase [Natranaerovirga pectinivora]